MSESFDINHKDFPPKPPTGGVTYSTYLKLDELLSLQQPVSRPEVHDEFLFILIHQVYELWFRQLLHELDAVRAAFDRDKVLVGHKIYRRIIAIQRVLFEQIKVLETMTPEDFNDFREVLNPASGFQSAQFRELEALCGLKDPRFLKLHRANPEVHQRLNKRLTEPSIYDAFIGLLKRRGFEVGEGTPEPNSEASQTLVDAFKMVYKDPDSHYDIYLMCEYLIESDELFQLWRFAHVKMVERTIGARMGTGGSPGSKYLKSTLNRTFFPELWEVRSQLGSDTW
jgi:tryptophan 2,3-dioxygenase